MLATAYFIVFGITAGVAWVWLDNKVHGAKQHKAASSRRNFPLDNFLVKAIAKYLETKRATVGTGLSD